MSRVWEKIFNRGSAGGVVTGYPLDALYEEIAYLGYYMHWHYDTLLNLEHWERRKWCEETGKINKKVNSEEDKKNFFDV